MLTDADEQELLRLTRHLESLHTRFGDDRAARRRFRKQP
jgi:hypothetical protein